MRKTSKRLLGIYLKYEINKNYLKGRTINGIHIELMIHWALSRLFQRAKTADMGGTNVDSNAWWFDTANAARIVGRLVLKGPLGILTGTIRDAVRYI